MISKNYAILQFNFIINISFYLLQIKMSKKQNAQILKCFSIKND